MFFFSKNENNKGWTEEKKEQYNFQFRLQYCITPNIHANIAAKHLIIINELQINLFFMNSPVVTTHNRIHNFLFNLNNTLCAINKIRAVLNKQNKVAVLILYCSTFWRFM